MTSSQLFSKTRSLFNNLLRSSKKLNFVVEESCVRGYAKKQQDDGCSKAYADIPPEVDPVCPQPCERRKKKKEGILHKIALKVIEGGTNFGTPFRRLKCEKTVEKRIEQKALPAPPPKEEESKKKKEVPAMPSTRPGVQVSILGADTSVGQYVALLLKQCPAIKKLRLYEAQDTSCTPCSRDLCQIVQDLQHIDTNCTVQAFSCACNELERCLQNTDIVLMLESGYVNGDMPFEQRFMYQAPFVKRYADVIATECPKAFIIVCASPVDCMVPLVAETLKETNWYDPRKLLGSLAVPEMRASTIAARALCLEPRYTRVPCVGGTEGEALVPLFSKAIEYFDFAEQNAAMLTETVRAASMAVVRTDGCCNRAADLSEAHALAGLVIKVAHALLCQDIARCTGFVETDATQVISPAKFIANMVEIGGPGIIKNFGLPKMNDHETEYTNSALLDLCGKLRMVEDWHRKFLSSTNRLDSYKVDSFFTPNSYKRFDDCAYAFM